MTDTDPSGEEIALLRENNSWTNVFGMFPTIPPQTLRSRERRWKAKQPPECIAVGVQASETLDEDEVYERACARWQEAQDLEKRKAEQRLEFSHGPACLVFLADLHFGGFGVDYPRAFSEASIIRDTPGMYACFVGDAVNNFIAGKLLAKNLTGELPIDEGWILFKRWLGVIGPKLRLVVSGNHENWTRQLAGIDHMRDVTASVAPGAIYDRDDCRIKLKVGETIWPGRIRHKWMGKSIYSPTHGIERAAKWDHDFLWGVGAHNHSSGCARGFNVGGRSGMAVMCGTYKRIDDFAARLGFPKPNDSVAVALVFDEDTDSITGFESLPFAAAFMREMYGDVKGEG